eukprot:288437_1
MSIDNENNMKDNIVFIWNKKITENKQDILSDENDETQQVIIDEQNIGLARYNHHLLHRNQQEIPDIIFESIYDRSNVEMVVKYTRLYRQDEQQKLADGRERRIELEQKNNDGSWKREELTMDELLYELDFHSTDWSERLTELGNSVRILGEYEKIASHNALKDILQCAERGGAEACQKLLNIVLKK